MSRIRTYWYYFNLLHLSSSCPQFIVLIKINNVYRNVIVQNLWLSLCNSPVCENHLNCLNILSNCHHSEKTEQIVLFEQNTHQKEWGHIVSPYELWLHSFNSWIVFSKRTYFFIWIARMKKICYICIIIPRSNKFGFLSLGLQKCWNNWKNLI